MIALSSDCHVAKEGVIELGVGTARVECDLVEHRLK
jgi:hypothetical protein